ncbi:MAG: 50S ribosomal protein L23 [Gemmatimonadaceae bacterium]|jgi:large subunit ribosomal protein L23|nr:50S ribosomal protein L23 [Gemmatimonadaceae bacterium]MCW5826082.1 50S ribosomal protein L23 [Gemmatimonadaceae bacterium]
MPTLHRTIVRPLVTEKSSAAYQERGEYTFEVHPDANKTAIKQAIERLFGVTVTGVWTSQQRGKPRRVGTSAGLRPRWKKAIVTLKAGDAIEIFEG